MAVADAKLLIQQTKTTIQTYRKDGVAISYSTIEQWLDDINAEL